MTGRTALMLAGVMAGALGWVLWHGPGVSRARYDQPQDRSAAAQETRTKSAAHYAGTRSAGNERASLTQPRPRLVEPARLQFVLPPWRRVVEPAQPWFVLRFEPIIVAVER